MTRPICTVDGCENPNAAKGMCGTHYTRFKRNGHTGNHVPVRALPCSVEGCENLADGARGWCQKHWQRWRKHGDPLVVLPTGWPRVPGGYALHKVLRSKWSNMKARCLNPTDTHYHRYGGRGISICDEWLSDFRSFSQWSLSNGYSADCGLTLDRIDNDGNYEPRNCRWVPFSEQSLNTSRNVLLTAFGETKTAKEWSLDSRAGTTHSNILNRAKRGWPDEKAITHPTFAPGEHLRKENRE